MFRFMFIIFWIFSTLVLADPANRVDTTAKVSVDVVKPMEIEILLNENIYHSVFQGVSKNIDSSFFIRVKASPNAKMFIKYPSVVNLTSEANIIPLNIDEVSNHMTSNMEGDNRVLEVMTPENNNYSEWSFPYSISLSGTEAPGRYIGTIPLEVNWN